MPEWASVRSYMLPALRKLGMTTDELVSAVQAYSCLSDLEFSEE